LNAFRAQGLAPFLSIKLLLFIKKKKYTSLKKCSHTSQEKAIIPSGRVYYIC